MKKEILINSSIIAIIFLSHLSVMEVSSAASDKPTVDPVRTWEASPVTASSVMSVHLSTPTHATINFDAKETKEIPANEVSQIPHLVLKRNGVLTPGYERTLDITINNVPVYPPGIMVELTITTQHRDPDTGKHSNEFVVWQGQQIVPHTALTQQGVRVNFSTVFNRTTKLENTTIPTPTDYYKYRVSVFDFDGNLRQSHTENYAFLMENQWHTPLPKLLETEPGAAPNQLLVYYYDMIPFQADPHDPTTQIPREGIDRYVQTELIPAMVNAIQLQSNVWGFPWYPEWRNFRLDEQPKTLSVALGEYGVWFHGTSASLGHSMITIRVDGSVSEYDNLTDGLMGIFHHELFHNLQRNITLHYNQNGNVAGNNEAWKMFSEGTAVLATSVGQSDIEFARAAQPRSHLKRVNAFIGLEGVVSSGLNKSYKDMPYQTATYWRFVYEQCGGIKDGKEEPTIGMKVIRSILETLYKGEVVDIYTSGDAVESLPAIMNKALSETEGCPFQSYKESLLDFASSIHMLGIEYGNCPMADAQPDCRFYDPNNLYPIPSAESFSISEHAATYIEDDIRSSYGIDIISLKFDADMKGNIITITFSRDLNTAAEFVVKAIKIKTIGINPGTSREYRQAVLLQVVNTNSGKDVIKIDPLDTAELDGIDLIIIRTDAKEKLDNKGYYNIQIDSL